MRAEMSAAVEAGADTVECRLDYLAAAPTRDELAILLTDPPVDVIVTYRPARQGGRFEGDEGARLALLRMAAKFAPAFIDIEADVPASDRPPGRLIVSNHDFKSAPADMDGVLSSLASPSSAVVKKVAFTPSGPEDALRALEAARSAEKPIISLAMGEHGLASRILAGKFGAFGTFAALDKQKGSAPGQPTIEEFLQLYRWADIGPDTEVYGVIASPVAHSMSPAIHNSAFGAAGIDAVYIPLLVDPGRDNFTRFMDAALSSPWLGLRGLSVTIPHKENALDFVCADRCDPLAVRIGAINTVTISPKGQLRGDNTDYAAAIDALCNTMDIEREGLSDRPVAVLGAGGVARAIVAALTHHGADVTIYNRTVSRGERLADDFACKAAGLEAIGGMDAEIVINCTSVGMHPKVENTPLSEIPDSVRVVFDTIYNPVQTRLLADAGAKGCLCVSGRDMFVNQAVAQFEIWTGKPAPRNVMKQVMTEKLSQEG